MKNAAAGLWRNSFLPLFSPSPYARAHLPRTKEEVLSGDPPGWGCAARGERQHLRGGKEKHSLPGPEIGKATGFVFHPQTAATR